MRDVEWDGMRRRLSLRSVLLCLMAVAIIAMGGALAYAQDESDLAGLIPAGMSDGQMVRGTVSSAGGDRIVVKTDKGAVYQVTVTGNTRIVKDRRPFKLVEIRSGDSVGAMGVLDAPAKTVHALFVMVVDAEEMKKAREGLGKIYIAGKVTGIDEVKLTILRPDNVTQVIVVDEGTSFRRGGRQMTSAMSGFGPTGEIAKGPRSADIAGTESITLSDIKVGDSVLGKGELKRGTFVPTQLAVANAASKQHQRRPDGANSEASAGGPR